MTTINYQILELIKHFKSLKTSDSSSQTTQLDDDINLNEGTCCECTLQRRKLRLCITCAEKAGVLRHDDIKKEFVLNVKNNDVNAALRRAKEIAICGDCARDAVQHEGHETVELVIWNDLLKDREDIAIEKKMNMMRDRSEAICKKLTYKFETTMNSLEFYFKMYNMLPASEQKIHFDNIKKELEKINGEIILADDASKRLDILDLKFNDHAKVLKPSLMSARSNSVYMADQEQRPLDPFGASNSVDNKLTPAQPHPSVATIHIEVKDTIPQTIHVEYNGAAHENCFGSRVVKNSYNIEDFRRDFLREYTDRMKNQTDPLKIARLNFFNGIDFLQTFPNHQKIKTEKLELHVGNQQEAMGVLSLVDANYLKTIEIKPYTSNNCFRDELAVNELGATKHWKKATELIMNTLLLPNPISEVNYAFLEKVDLLVDSLSVEDLVFLKEKFFTPPYHLHRYKVTFNQFLRKNNQNQSLEEIDLNHSSAWHCLIQENPNQVLSIAYILPPKSFIFTRLNLGEVPEDVQVRN